MSTAIYARVSTNSQDTKAQEVDLKKWADGQPVQWYRDKATGLKMARPGMDALLNDIRSGRVTKLVVWRLDRLGRTAIGLLGLLKELQERKVGFVSLREGIDLSTASGRLLVVILSGVAEFEAEVRSERQRSGIQAAKDANGGKVPWGGRKPGTRIRVTEEKEAAVRKMKAENTPIAEIARVTELSRQTIYRVLGEWERPKTD